MKVKWLGVPCHVCGRELNSWDAQVTLFDIMGGAEQ